MFNGDKILIQQLVKYIVSFTLFKKILWLCTYVILYGEEGKLYA